MADQANMVLYPSSYSELFALWNRYPRAVPFAGGTALIREQGRQVFELPPIILSLEGLEEMRRISRSERYLEIGAMVTLSQILHLGKVVPAALCRCLEHIAGLQLRNMATIGGNICFSGGRLDSPAVLAALDAQYELRNAQSSRWISAPRFFTALSAPVPSAPALSAASSDATAQNTTALKPNELLTRIRIPLDNWDYSAYKKIEGQASRSKVVVFLAKTQKTTLNDIRIVYKNNMIWRNKDSETMLIGRRLPLNHKIAVDFIKSWETFLSGIQNIDELSAKELFNFIKIHINNLSE